MKHIGFNKPYLTGKENHYISQVINSGNLSGNGVYTKKCQTFFEKKYGFKKCLLTTSCTDALEMAAILADINFGDEVIIPSYTFVSTALAFIRQGAKVVFIDSCSSHPNIDVDNIEPLITSKTKAIVPVHYAGVACDMGKIMQLADKYNLVVIEDAAQAIDSFYKNKEGSKKALGSIGHFGTFSFHETKNITSGEGGMLAINDEKFIERAEIVWEKGTNRSKFFRGEIDKYGWVDIGSSFLPSELNAAFLWAQIQYIQEIQDKRIYLWKTYFDTFNNGKNNFDLPYIPDYATNNGHLFYLKFPDIKKRTEAIEKLKKSKISAVFHYLSLHKSPFYQDKHDGRKLPESDKFSNCLIRLPMYYELQTDEVLRVVDIIKNMQ